MSALSDLLAIPEADGPDEPWFEEPRDSLPGSEFKRQRTFLAMLKRLGPKCVALAIPNASSAGDWEKIRRWSEGARAGACDLIILWPAGIFFAEMKAGKGDISPAQRDFLNDVYRLGHPCGVYRQPETLVDHLRAAGAPIREAQL